MLDIKSKYDVIDPLALQPLTLYFIYHNVYFSSKEMALNMLKMEYDII